MTAANIHYKLADRVCGLSALLILAPQNGLPRDIDANLQLLKRRAPYFESDHVLNIAFNILAGGSRIEHIELRRSDEVSLNALGGRRILDPTTAGDSCRRFQESDCPDLMTALIETGQRVWSPHREELRSIQTEQLAGVA